MSERKNLENTAICSSRHWWNEPKMTTLIAEPSLNYGAIWREIMSRQKIYRTLFARNSKIAILILVCQTNDVCCACKSGIVSDESQVQATKSPLELRSLWA